MRERVLRSLRITRKYVASDRSVLLLGATPESSVGFFPGLASPGWGGEGPADEGIYQPNHPFRQSLQVGRGATGSCERDYSPKVFAGQCCSGYHDRTFSIM